jgi:ubiquinone/menaquinone biosynthesis C-methylase UbiE
VSFNLHRRYLRRYVESGDHILEAGAGAGRFTIEPPGSVRTSPWATSRTVEAQSREGR